MQTASAPRHLSRSRCSECGGALTVHEAVRGGHCATQACSRSAVKREIRRREEAAAALLAARVAELRSAVVTALGLENDSLATAVVPASNRPAVKLPRRRKNELRRYLTELVAASFAQDADSTALPLPDDELPSAPQFDAETRAVQDGCATCRGHCCRLGAVRHAFLDAITMRRYRSLRPRLRAREIVAAYLSRVPACSVENSCVFHGTSGCTLARPMRAAICNDYHCSGLDRIQVLAADPDVRAVLIVAAADSNTVRWTVHEKAAADASAAAANASTPR